MEITEVRIKLMDEPGDRLKAFCSITFDNAFVVRDLKIIEGATGPFVAMPSRKLTSHCHKCGTKNHLRACFCNQCGQRLSVDQAEKDSDGRAKLYADIAHPINSECRELIQDRVISEFENEMQRAEQPGYTSRYDDFEFDDDPPKQTRLDRAHEQTSGPHHESPPPSVSPQKPKKPHFDSPQKHVREDDFGAGIF